MITVMAGIIVVMMFSYSLEPDVEERPALYQEKGKYSELIISYPLDETLFPPEIVAPTFRWEDGASGVDS